MSINGNEHQHPEETRRQADGASLESLCEDFEEAWIEQPYPDLKLFLTTPGHHDLAGVAAELVHIDLERRWRSRIDPPEADPLPARPRLEDYVVVLSELGALDSLPLGLITGELRIRHLWGDQPSVSDYVTRFPQHSAELMEQYARIASAMEQPLAQESASASAAKDAPDMPGAAFADLTLDHNEAAEQSAAQSFETLTAGVQVDRYVLKAKLGEGGCGVVFRAYDVNSSDRECAVKLIRPDRLAVPKVQARFQQEIRALKGLSHSNIVCATDSGEWNGIQYFVMEYVDGVTLRQIADQCNPLSIANACELVRQASLGLQHIHETRRTHRDLKPSNLILTVAGVVKILDLGMARLLDIDDPNARLTSFGEIMGTPEYMAPEQWMDSSRVDIRADIYSLGCTLYRLLAGRPPFVASGRDTMALMRAHARVPVPDIAESRDDIPVELREILARCLAKRVEDRFQQPVDLAESLHKFTADAGLIDLVTTASHSTVKKVDLPPAEDPTSTVLSDGLQSCERKSPDEHPDTALPDQSTCSPIGRNTLPRRKAPSTVTDSAAHPDAVETIIERPASTAELAFEETLIQRRAELEAIDGEETLDPQVVPTGPSGESAKQQSRSATRQTLGSYSTIGSVVLRQRDVTFGRVGDNSIAEYEIGHKLGEGGMGAVFQARQGSVDRTVALKMVKGRNVARDAREKFLAEAVVTGALEHPNIIPIYDLGANAEGELFYAMKEVRGVPWRKSIDTASEDENLDILIKVADAIAFAHSRGVLHRDLKPHNVMIGEFGEVLVMDWGLALPMEAFARPGLAVTHGPAGTPSYMAPEMTGRSPELLGTCSDVYLLGALLFRCLTGRPPHTARNAFAALQAAADNAIDWPEGTEANADLLAVARRAMATDPSDRYESAIAFQQALRAYRSHAESRRLTESALDELQKSTATADYRSFERVTATLEEALHLWPENERARLTLQQARLSYAQTAFNRGDLELAETQLDLNDDLHTTLLSQVRNARTVREAQTRRLRRLKRTAAGMAAAVFLTVSVAAVLIDRARERESIAKTEAVDRFRDSQAAISELSDMADALRDYPLAQAQREQLLEAVTRYYERQTSSLSDVPTLRLEQLHSLVRLGQIQNQLAEYDQADETWNRIDKLTTAFQMNSSDNAVAADAGEPIQEVALIHSQAELGRSRTFSALGRHAQAIEAARRATNELKENIERSPSEPAGLELALAQLQVAHAIHDSLKPHLAEPAADEAVKYFEKLDSQNAAIGHAAAEGLLARIHERESLYPQAVDNVARAIRIWDRLLSSAPTRVDYIDGLATSWIDRANILRAAGCDPLSDYSDSVNRFQELVELRPGIPRYRFNLGTALTGLAWTQNRLCLTTSAQDSAVQAVNTFLYLHQRYPQDTRFPLGEAAARLVLGVCLRTAGV
ncbi:protein kinase [bacterium]|nr:protein kinase [bacterium]